MFSQFTTCINKMCSLPWFRCHVLSQEPARMYLNWRFSFLTLSSSRHISDLLVSVMLCESLETYLIWIQKRKCMTKWTFILWANLFKNVKARHWVILSPRAIFFRGNLSSNKATCRSSLKRHEAKTEPHRAFYIIIHYEIHFIWPGFQDQEIFNC